MIGCSSTIKFFEHAYNTLIHDYNVLDYELEVERKVTEKLLDVLVKTLYTSEAIRNEMAEKIIMDIRNSAVKEMEKGV